MVPTPFFGPQVYPVRLSSLLVGTSLRWLSITNPDKVIRLEGEGGRHPDPRHVAIDAAPRRIDATGGRGSLGDEPVPGEILPSARGSQGRGTGRVGRRTGDVTRRALRLVPGGRGL